MALIATTHPDITRMLRRVGFQVLETADPMDAAPQADLVVLPFANRPLNGEIWCQQLRRTSVTLPVLLVTRTEEEVTLALTAGASDVLRQPLREDILAARCRGWLAAGRVRTPADRYRGPHDLPTRLLDAAPDPIIACDHDGLIIFFNRAAELITGYGVGEVISRMRLRDLYASSADAARIKQELSRSNDQCLRARALKLRTRTGERVPVRLSTAMVQRRSGEVVGQVGLYRDDRENEDLVDRLGRATEQLIAAERRADAARSANSAAYELNQPLTSTMGIIELLMMRPGLSGPNRDKLERAYTQLERMADTVRGLAQLTAYQPTSRRTPKVLELLSPPETGSGV